MYKEMFVVTPLIPNVLRTHEFVSLVTALNEHFSSIDSSMSNTRSLSSISYNYLKVKQRKTAKNVLKYSNATYNNNHHHQYVHYIQTKVGPLPRTGEPQTTLYINRTRRH